jgi:hypothetical protein
MQIAGAETCQCHLFLCKLWLSEVWPITETTPRGMGLCIRLPSLTDVEKKETCGGVCSYDSLVCLHHRRP